MPPIVSHQVDTDGVALVAAWLNGFPQCRATPLDAERRAAALGAAC